MRNSQFFGERKMKKGSLSILTVLIILNINCSSFVIRHTDNQGKAQTYITDTVFVGTGTFLDCIISPFHWLAGLFYKQPYIHVQGSNLSYPSFGASGCFASSYSKNSGALSGFGLLNIGLFKENPGNSVYFTDTEDRERAIIGGSFEISRVTKRINFKRK